MNNFNKLSLYLGVKLIYKCLYEKERQKAWDMWVSIYPNMRKENFMSFDKFFNHDVEDLMPKEQKTVQDMLKTAEEIGNKMATGRFREVKV